MSIQWNKITWYSKALALGLFVLISFGGFWLGFYGGYLKGYVNGARVAMWEPTSKGTGIAPYYENVAEWQVNRSDAGGFSIAYPLDFPTDTGAVIPSTDWRYNSPEANRGVLFFALTIPKAFEPQTNFSEAKLTVGASRSGSAVSDCLAGDSNGGPMTTTSTATINGTTFVIFHSSDAGAGNLYETTSYRTIHAGQCYAVEYTIHSSQIANYPAEYGLKPFDKAKLTDVLDRIVGTFRFL